MQDFPGWTTQFELFFRQEQSRQASGRTIVKDFGTPLWTATYQSRPLRPNLLDEWRARLNALGGGLWTFRAWPMSRCWPISDPRGAVLTGGGRSGPTLMLDFRNNFGYASVATPPGAFAVGYIGADNKSLMVAGLPSAFVWSIGDFLQIGQRLHQVTSKAGDMITVAPHFAEDISVGQAVVLHRPSVEMTIIPGSISTPTALNGRGSVSFRAIEARG